MALIPFPINQFGGVRLDADPTELGTDTAVDVLNVDLDRAGTVRARDGLAAVFTQATLPASGMGAYATTAGLRHLAIAWGGAAGHVEIRDTAGSLLALSLGIANPKTASTARWGDPTHEYLYVTMGGAAQRWDGTTLTTANVPAARFVAVKSDSTRLVAANIAGTGTQVGVGKSRIGFSNPGAPETWTYSVGPPETGNFVDLAPGDGSQITGLANWREQIFAFKEQRFFVFGGESTENDGSVVFNYRPVEGYGATVPVVAGDEGVYFFDGRTVWLTTGSTPTRLSGPVDRFLRGQTTLAGSTYSPSGMTPTMSYSQGRLYLTVATTGTLSVLSLVYDARHDFWTVMSWAGNAVAPVAVVTLPDANSTPTTYAYMTNGHVVRLDSSLTDDAGTAITWGYQTGYSDAGGYFRARIISSGERKRHFKTDIEGSGTVTHQVLALNARPGDTADPGGTVTLGTAPAIARGSRRRGVRGTYFAHKLSGSGPAVINGLTYWLANVESDT